MRVGFRRAVLVLASLAGAPLGAQEACQERTLEVPFQPQVGGANNWCWASTGQMVMERLGQPPETTCQCQQAERVLGVTGCCAAPTSCAPADEVPSHCDRPRWPSFAERPDLYPLDYATTCDGLPGRQNDSGCDMKALDWHRLTVEICSGRPFIAALRPRGSLRGHTVIVKGFSTRPERRVLVVDPKRLCAPGRDHCEGQLDEARWIPYEEYVAGWGGMVHWVDFYGIRKK